MPAMFKTAAAFTLSLPLLCQAGLNGSSVTGSLRFVGPKNFFDPINGLVPADTANQTSATVTVTEPGTEFGYQDSASRITANFTNLQLTIAEAAFDNGEGSITRFDFIDTAFVDRVAVPVSNSYPVNPTISLSEDFLTVNLPAYDLSAGNTRSLTLALTLPGDADLNGTVNFNDFLVLQNNFGQPNTTFQQGNFNFDGQTDFNDFLVLQNNFGGSVDGGATMPSAAEVAALTAFAANVPEPAGFAAIGAMAVGMLRRHRHRA